MFLDEEHIMKKILILITSFILYTSANAAAIYQVEMIIFSHIQTPNLNSERWPILESSQVDLRHVWQLKPLAQRDQTNNDKPASYQILPNYYLHLTKQRALLAKMDRYQPLLHITWYQDVLTPKDAHWLHIFGGKGFDNSGKIVAENYDGSAQYNQATHWQVDGLVRIGVKRYFDASYKLAFATPTETIQSLSQNDNFKGLDTPLVYFNLNQTRRMRSNELNFIDHPLYGIIMKITPL